MFLTLVLLGVMGLFIWKLLDEDQNPLDRLPGPPRYPIIGYALKILSISRRDIFQKRQQLNKLYGDRYVIKLWTRRLLCLSNVKDAEGHDTAAMAIVFALMLIADHEEVQDRIYKEIQSILGDSDRAPSMSDLADMKYLEAVIKETLRLYPSVPYIAREITEDFMLGDLPVTKGVEVGIYVYELQRRADLFPDPEAFKPERFLSGEPMHPYAFIGFSAGPRNCIGKRFAMLEMKSVLSSICRNFKLSPRVRGARPELMVDVLLRPVDHIYIKFTTR